MADNLTTLTAPNGSTVKVSEEKAERLLQQGYAEKSTAKSSSAKK